MSRGRMAARTDRVVRAHRLAAAEVEIRRLAARLGVSEAELRYEAEEVERVCRLAGAVTEEERLAAVAADLGVSLEELRREVAQIRAEEADVTG